MLVTREILEAQEAHALAPYAIKSSETEGRAVPEELDDFRLPFQKDKERVVHSKAFRRLDQKTQVLNAGTGDHYRTRLTHTLEVAQISRGVARRLGLNEDLAEVIALAHDLGHPPFGHAGEDALDEIMRGYGLNFEHNQQSKRVVEVLERSYPSFEGLNLSIEVLEGLMKHQTAFDQAGREFEVAAHLEAQVVNIGDEIAYTNHDIDDGIRFGLIKNEDLQQFELWCEASELMRDKYGDGFEGEIANSRTISKMISLMIEDLCAQTESNLQQHGIESVAAVKEFKGILAGFSSDMRRKVTEIRNFLYENFYLSDAVKAKNEEGKKMIRDCFDFLVKNPDKFPREDFGDPLEVAVKDYIAGMTDRFLISLSHDLSKM